MDRKTTLTGILDLLKKDTSGEKVSMGELVETLNSRGFGPLILFPAVITVLPTGAIPFMPDVCALIIIFVSMQILLHRKHPWIPKKIKNVTIERDTFLQAIDQAEPVIKKLDRYFHPRVKLLLRKGVEPFIAVLCIILSVAMILMSWVPFLAMIPAAGVMFLGLGLTTRDGFLVAAAFIFIAGCIFAVPYAWQAIFS